MKWVVLLCLSLATLFVTPRSEAATTCSITSITTLAFGAVDPTGGTVDGTATINYSCTYTGGLLGGLYGVYLTGCIGLAADDQSAISPRTIVNASSDRMQYQLFKESQRTNLWGPIGNTTYTPLTFQVNFTILASPQTRNGSVTVYGRVPAGQSTLSSGPYTGTLAGGTTGNGIAYRYNEVLLSIGGYPASCQAGGAAGGSAAGPASTVTASVSKLCTIASATELNFGTNVSGLLRTNTDQTSLLRMTCTNRAAYQVGLDNGRNASGAVRRMTSGQGFVNYELYRDSQRTLRWGDTLDTDTMAGAGSGVEQTLTVYGRVPVQPPVHAGDYNDTVTVTVTY